MGLWKKKTACLVRLSVSFPTRQVVGVCPDGGLGLPCPSPCTLVKVGFERGIPSQYKCFGSFEGFLGLLNLNSSPITPNACSHPTTKKKKIIHIKKYKFKKEKKRCKNKKDLLGSLIVFVEFTHLFFMLVLNLYLFQCSFM